MIEKKKTICPLDCPDSCGLIASVENGKVIKIEGDPDHGNTKGFICAKMRSYHQRIESPNRILQPLLRTGSKGSGEFKAISWDEAWTILVDKLNEVKKEHGAESILRFYYAGNMGHIHRSAGNPFFNKLGATRFLETICSSTAKAGWRAHMGSCPGTEPEKAADASLILAWGINVKATNIHFWPIIQKARRKGGKLVVIDPYKNPTAKVADYYFPVKPGGDSALALGALKVIVENNQQNESFISAKTKGFAELAEYLAQASWKEIEKDSGIDKDSIEDLANLLIENPKTFIRIGIGLSRNTRGAMSVRAITCLGLALGLMSPEKGKGILLSSSGFSGSSNKVDYDSLREKESRVINMVQLSDAMTSLDPKIHLLFSYNCNPLSVVPEASLLRKGLERDDLFTVVHEQLMTPTARYAELILPATTAFENRDVYVAYGHFYMGTSEPVIPPKGEAIDNFTLFQTLASKMGFDDAPFKQTLEERIQDYLSDMAGIPDGIDRKSLKAGDYAKSTLADFNKVEKNFLPFRFVSNNLEPGQPPIPSLGLLKEFDDEELALHFPLKLITPPNSKLLNSTFGDRYLDTPGDLLIHPDDASTRKINQGDRVLVFNRRGSVIRNAKITDDTQQGLVVAEGIYWESPNSKTQGINDLTSQRTADLGGGGTFHESRVEVNIA